MDSSFLGAPNPSDIVFAGASAVSDPGTNFIGAPTASDIVFARASEVSGPQENLTDGASHIVFAGASLVSGRRKSLVGATSASDIVFAGASKVSGRRTSLIGVPTASDIVFAGASKVSGRRTSLIGVPTASDIVFAGASKVSGPQDEHTDTVIVSDPATRETEIVRSSALVNMSESNLVETQVTEGNLHHESAGIEASESLSFHNHVWNRDEIRALFDLFDTDNDGYLTTNDLVAFTHMFEVQTGGEKMKRYRRKNQDLGRGRTHDIIEKAGPDGRIDFSNFLKLVHQMDIDLDKPVDIQSNFLEFVRRRLVSGFGLSSSLRDLVIRFYITFTEKRDKELISKGISECTEQLRTVFNAFDDDGDGYLLTGEVKTFMRVWEKESDVVEQIIRQVELLYNGKVDFRDFLGLLQPADINLIRGTYALRLVPLLNCIFRLLDLDKDGSIAPTEVETFKRIWKPDPNEVEGIADKIDIPGNQNFDFPDLFNFFPLRMKSFVLKNFKEGLWLDYQLRFLFSLLDEDGDGCISVQEVKSFTRMWRMMPKEARYIIDKAEAAGDRIFYFPDFLNLLPTFEIDLYVSEVDPSSSSSKSIQLELITQMNHFFCSLDEDHDGRLTTKQVETFLCTWRLEPNIASDIVSAVDASGNGTIDFPYFLELLYSNDKMLANETQDFLAISSLVEMFRFLDEDMDSCLTSREVEILTHKYMLDLEENDAGEIMAEVDAHGEGLFDFPTLFNLLYPKSSELRFRLYADSEIAAVRNIFNFLPRTRYDCITAKEIYTFTRICKLSQTTTQDIMSKIHADGNGVFTLPQLFHLLCKAGVNFEEMSRENSKLEDKLRDIFHLFDEDKDGIITLDEMKNIWGMWKPDSPENEIDDLLHSFEAKGIHAVSFPHFLRSLYSMDIHPDKRMKSKVKDDKDAAMYAFLSDIFG